ncbi:MerR family transcriptional regulator, partial [Microbacterium maritypicum]
DDWSIQEIARLAGTTSRTLRHYDDIGLLPPSRVAHNGYRHYDGPALVRLQRILLLRELGLGLPQIADVLGSASDSDAAASEASALETHLALLRDEQTRLARQ